MHPGQDSQPKSPSKQVNAKDRKSNNKTLPKNNSVTLDGIGLMHIRFGTAAGCTKESTDSVPTRVTWINRILHKSRLK